MEHEENNNSHAVITVNTGKYESRMIRVPAEHALRLDAIGTLLMMCDWRNEMDGFKPDPLDGEQKGFVPTFYINYSTRRVCLRSSKPVTSHPVMLPVVLSTPERAEEFGERYIDLFNDIILGSYGR